MAKYSRTKRVTRSKKHHRRHRTRKNMRGGLGEGEQASGAFSSAQDTLTGLGTQASNMVSQSNETAQGEKKSWFSGLFSGGRRRRRRKSSHRKK